MGLVAICIGQVKQCILGGRLRRGGRRNGVEVTMEVFRKEKVVVSRLSKGHGWVKWDEAGEVMFGFTSQI